MNRRGRGGNQVKKSVRDKGRGGGAPPPFTHAGMEEVECGHRRKQLLTSGTEFGSFSYISSIDSAYSADDAERKLSDLVENVAAAAAAAAAVAPRLPRVGVAPRQERKAE